MITEERIAELESKIAGQATIITELYQATVDQQRMINDRVIRENEIQEQLNSLTELVITIGNKFT
jgi:uncharacterized coiled-coil protein SlyX